MEEHKLMMIVNPKAGINRSREPLYDAVCTFSEAGYLVRVRRTAAAGEAEEIAFREAEHYAAVVAVGGDGTLNECVSGLLRLRNPPPLGYLPRGSTNDFAASLHISSDPAEAARMMMSATPRKLDVGFWNGRHFVYVASFGAFTRSSYAAPQSAKNVLGHFAYILEGVRDLDTLRPYAVRIQADGEAFEGEFLFGAVCNSTSVGGLMKLDDAGVVLDDGLFELLLVPNPKNPAELQNLMSALVNREYDCGGLILRHISHLTLQTEEDLPWSLDGEYAPSAPEVEIANRRQALTMLL